MSSRQETWERFLKELAKNNRTLQDIKGSTKDDIRPLCKEFGFSTLETIDVLTTFDEQVSALQSNITRVIEVSSSNSSVSGEITKRAKILIEEVDVGLVNPVVAADQWIDTNHMLYSGLAESKRIYVRKDCLNLWTLLDADGNCYVRGTPGTGKSTIAWQWCVYKASQGASVRWIHYDRARICQIVEFKDRKFRVMKDIFDDYQTGASVFVLDGIYPEIAKDIAYYLLQFNTNLKSNLIVKLVLVSSLASDWRGPEYETYSPKLYTMSGWTLDEYKSACKDDPFRALVEAKLDADPLAFTIEDKIDAKFDIAGHSARWMFNYDSSFVIQQANAAIERCLLKREILEGLEGTEAKFMVHNLFSSFENGTKKVIVSPFVVRQLSTRWGLKFISKLTTWGIKERNNSVQADFMTRMKE